MSIRRMWVLFDGRACGGVGTSDASVLVICESEAEARCHRGDFGSMAAYSYRKEGSDLVDERWEWDYLD